MQNQNYAMLIALNNHLQAIRFFLYCLVAIMLNSTIFSALEYFCTSNIQPNPILEKESLAFRIIIGILIAPLLETYLFQKLPFLIMSRLKVKSMLVRITLPSLAFAINHSFSIFYVGFAFVTGIILNYMYIACKENNKGYAFIAVALIHSIYNTIALALPLLFEHKSP